MEARNCLVAAEWGWAIWTTLSSAAASRSKSVAACFGATSDSPGELMTCRFLGMFPEIWGQSEEPSLLTDWGSHRSKAVVLGSVEKHSRVAKMSRAVGKGPGEAAGVQ